MEALDVIRSVRWHRQLPWNVQSGTIDPPQRSVEIRPGEENLPAPGRLAYGVAALLRMLIGGVVSGVLAATYPPTAVPLVMFLVGLGALSVIERLTKLAPLLVTALAHEAASNAADQVQQTQQQSATSPAQQASNPSADASLTGQGAPTQPNTTGAGGIA